MSDGLLCDSERCTIDTRNGQSQWNRKTGNIDNDKTKEEKQMVDEMKNISKVHGTSDGAPGCEA